MGWQWNGKTALITGASSGIGREFALQLHAKGVRVILIARRELLLQELIALLTSRRPDSAEAVVADLAKRQGAASLETVRSVLRTAQVDILINNAGRGSFGEFETLSLEEECTMIDLNVKATLVLAHEAFGYMKARRSGALVTVSSIAAFQPLPYMATYAGTKAFNLFHSLALRNEARAHKIRVLAVCPGPTATEFGGVARVPGTATGITRDSVGLVVRESIKALERNKAVIVPGMRSRWLALLCRFLPLSLSTWWTGRMLQPALNQIHND